MGWWFAVLRSSAAAIKMCHRHLIKPICVQYGFRFFVTEKSESVSSAAGRPGFQGAALNDFWLLFFTEK